MNEAASAYNNIRQVVKDLREDHEELSIGITQGICCVVTTTAEGRAEGETRASDCYISPFVIGEVGS